MHHVIEKYKYLALFKNNITLKSKYEGLKNFVPCIQFDKKLVTDLIETVELNMQLRERAYKFSNFGVTWFDTFVCTVPMPKAVTSGYNFCEEFFRFFIQLF